MRKKSILLILFFSLLVLCLKTAAQESKSTVKIIDEAIEFGKKGELERAENLLQKNITSSPKDPQLHYWAGKIYKQKNDPKNALEEMNKAISLKGDMLEAYYDTGIIYKEMGLKGDAVENLKKGFKISHQKSNSLMQIKFVQELNNLEAFPPKEQTWIEQSYSNISGCVMNSTFFTDEMQGVAVGSIDYNNEIIILRTTDGGKNWKIIKPDLKGSLKNVFFANKNLGWAVGYEGNILPRKLIVKTSNGGKDWTPMYPDDTKGFLSSVFFLDINEGWVAGGSMVYHTTDGGIKWIPENKFNAGRVNFNDLFFINSDIGWVAGFENTFNEKKGVIYKTVDGGKNWIKLKETSVIEINKLHFIDSNRGWAAGWDGTSPYGSIISTTNGGKDWKIQKNITDNNMKLTGYDFPGILKDIYFLDHQNGLACGLGSNGTGLLLKTSDGGQTWYREDTDFLNSASFSSLFFLNINKGWVVGEQLLTGPVIIANKKGKTKL